MTNYRKALSLILALLMVLSLFPVIIGADAPVADTEPEWPNEGAVLLNKSAAAVAGEDNLWEVTLTVEGKNFKTTSDVVLVIDCSGSMKGTRIENTRTAAKAFGEKLLVSGSSTRIAIVTYSDNAAAYNDGHFYTATELKAFEAAIDAATKSPTGGTNQQGGIHLAQQLLSSEKSTGRQKNIVILSDGKPTFSYKFVVTATYEGCTRDSVLECYIRKPTDGTVKVQSVAMDYTDRVGDGTEDTLLKKNASLILRCSTHNTTSEYDSAVYQLDGTLKYGLNWDSIFASMEHDAATIWEATQAKNAGTTIYSVALQAGDIGEAILKACATDSATDYYKIGASETDVAGKLTTAFTRIAGSIAIAASDAVATDTMGEHVQLTFAGEAPVITTDATVYAAGNADLYVSQGSATFDETTQTITWIVGNVREGETSTMKYKVQLVDGYNPNTGTVIPTNKSASLEYKNYLGNTVEKPFPVPQVTVGGGTILVHWYMVNADGQPISTSGVVVEGPAYAKQIQEAAYYSADGSSGLSYNTEYTVSPETFTDYTYFGKYILNSGTLTTGDSVGVTLTVANPNQEVWFAYTQGFRVGHVQYDEITESLDVTYTQHVVAADFDLTEQVTDGYLYGGSFSNIDCTTVQTFATGENATSFLPEAGEIYYIWEVDEKYLVPKHISCWEHNDAGALDVMGYFITVPIDREYYNEVGFFVNEEEWLVANQVSEEYVSDDGDYLIAIQDTDGSIVYQNVAITQKDGNVSTINTATYSIDRGYLAVVSLDKETYWSEADAEITFTPYWITMDGVKVVSATTRTSTYMGAGSTAANKKFALSDGTDSSGWTCDYVGVEEEQTMLAVYASFLCGVTVDLPTASNPTTSEQPEVSGDSENMVVVTVHDNEDTWTLNCEKESNIAENVYYAGLEGYLFAGWYADEEYETPAALSCVTEDMDIYAKYVEDSYLRLKYTDIAFFNRRMLTMYTTAEKGKYQEIGFIVNGAYNKARYNSSMVGTKQIFDNEMSRNATLYSCSVFLNNCRNGDTFEVTPYWITMDGTTVLGETRVLTVTRFGLQD